MKIFIVMLGDSVFDNGRYVPGEPDVHSRVSEQLKLFYPNSELTFVAEDGAVIRDVFERQIQKIPEDATHVALSIGGNDLLGLSHNLQHQVGNFPRQSNISIQSKAEIFGKFSKCNPKNQLLRNPFCSLHYLLRWLDHGNRK